MIIGITGQIGSGKSTVAALFRKLGAVVVDADRIGRQVVEGKPQLRQALVRAFGPSILGKHGKIDRRRLAELAFASKKSKRTLDRLVHPHLLIELRRQVRVAERNRTVVIDAALLLDWHMDREVETVVLVHASREVRLQRLVAKGLSSTDALARIRSQMPYRRYLQRAQHLILNSGTPKELERKAIRLWHRLIGQTD